MDPDKIARIRDWPVPSTVAEHRSFLGLASYYQKKVILFTYKHALKSHPNVAVTVGEQPVRPATSIHNLGEVYDQPLSMIQHVNSVCRVGYMHNIVTSAASGGT